MVVGIESDGWLMRKSGLVKPIPIGIDVREIGDNQIGNREISAIDFFK